MADTSGAKDQLFNEWGIKLGCRKEPARLTVFSIGFDGLAGTDDDTTRGVALPVP